MKTIECILHRSLEDYFPDSLKSNHALVEFESTPSVNDILAHFNIDEELLQFVLADGCYIELEHWHEPSKGKQFQFWPRISGG
jgi:hypothetical protein